MRSRALGAGVLAVASCLAALTACNRTRRDSQCLALDDFDPNRGVSYREAWADELEYECKRPSVGARVYPDCDGYHVVEEQAADPSRDFYYDAHSGRLVGVVEHRSRLDNRCFGALVTVSTSSCVQRADCGNPGGL
jgi:hypothetical protein